MQSISTLRLYLLRAMYLLLAVGLGLSIWPSIISAPLGAADSRTVVQALLGAIGVLALLGIRYPLRMLPLLLFELLWKAIWLVAYAFPHWRSGSLDATTTQNAFECLAGVVLVLLVAPWGYIIQNYVRASAEPWRRVATTRIEASDV